MDFPRVNLGGRNLALYAQVGSHNYNLNTRDSDKDYKFFVIPSFEDLYYGKKFSHAETSQNFDYTVFDVRKLPEFLWRGHINFIEILYSVDAECFSPELESLFENRDAIVSWNLPQLYKTNYGMSLAKIENLHKGTETTKPLIQKFGYDTKEALHALRVLYTLSRFSVTMDIERALTYNRGEAQYKILMQVKNGEMSEAEFLAQVERWHVFNKGLSEWYANQPQNKEGLESMNGLVRTAVKSFFGGEIASPIGR